MKNSANSKIYNLSFLGQAGVSDLYYVRVPVVTNKLCKKRYSSTPYDVTDSMICAAAPG